MKIRDAIAPDDVLVLDADFPIRCQLCGDKIGYRTPGDDPGYTFCLECHDARDDDVVETTELSP